MDAYVESHDVTVNGGGFIGLSVARAYPDGLMYRSTLFVAAADAASVAAALLRFVDARVDATVALRDGTLRVFGLAPRDDVNLELMREAALPHGGYDTCDMAPATARQVAARLVAMAS